MNRVHMAVWKFLAGRPSQTVFRAVFLGFVYVWPHLLPWQSAKQATTAGEKFPPLAATGVALENCVELGTVENAISLQLLF